MKSGKFAYFTRNYVTNYQIENAAKASTLDQQWSSAYATNRRNHAERTEDPKISLRHQHDRNVRAGERQAALVKDESSWIEVLQR